MDMTEFKTKYPDLHNAIFEEGKKEGLAEGLSQGEAAGIEKGKTEAQDQARVAGATAERERIQSVEAQSIPGHEKLIQELKFDGKTTGEQAAVKILQSEKALRLNMQTQLQSDGVLPLSHVPAPAVDDGVASMPDGPDKWKAEYEKSPELQKEFKACETYVAYMAGVAAGDVKIFGKKAK
jgi:hypothetical protein